MNAKLYSEAELHHAENAHSDSKNSTHKRNDEVPNKEE